MIWNSIPNQIKASKDIAQFKENVKPWGNENCEFFKKIETYYNTMNSLLSPNFDLPREA